MWEAEIKGRLYVSSRPTIPHPLAPAPEVCADIQADPGERRWGQSLLRWMGSCRHLRSQLGCLHTRSKDEEHYTGPRRHWNQTFHKNKIVTATRKCKTLNLYRLKIASKYSNATDRRGGRILTCDYSRGLCTTPSNWQEKEAANQWSKGHALEVVSLMRTARSGGQVSPATLSARVH